MSQPFVHPSARYFQDLEVGTKIFTQGRTITEADIVNFAGLSGDFNQIHTDSEYSKNSPAGERVAHGLLGLSIASGLAVQTGVLEGTVVYFREVNEWKFIQPVFIGDTIHVELEVLETKPLRRIGSGAVTITLDVKNQNNQTVMKGNWVVLIAFKPA